MATNCLRCPTRSDRLPDQSLSRLASESASPSIAPSENLFPLSTVSRKLGSKGNTISVAMSFSKLAAARILTFRGRAGRSVVAESEVAGGGSPMMVEILHCAMYCRRLKVLDGDTSIAEATRTMFESVEQFSFLYKVHHVLDFMPAWYYKRS